MMKQQRTLVQIYSAAFYFAHISRDIHKIAEVFSVSTYAIRKWAKTEDWDFALDTFGYEGDRSFAGKTTRDSERDAGAIFEKARQAYQKAIAEGVPTSKLATVAGKAVGLSRRRVHSWATKHGWRDETETGGK